MGEFMGYETLTFSVTDNVATITLNRPDSMNAMSPLMAKELHQVALAVDERADVRAVILTGAGKMFCAGGDLSAFAAAGEGARRLIMEMTGDLHMALSRLARNPAPVIAAVMALRLGQVFRWLWPRTLLWHPARLYSLWPTPTRVYPRTAVLLITCRAKSVTAERENSC